MKQLNLNTFIKVKLTDHGKDIFYHQYDELNNYIIKNGGTPIKPGFPEIDAEGYSELLLWQFMQIYGKHIAMGAKNVIEPLNIYIDDNDVEEVDIL